MLKQIGEIKDLIGLAGASGYLLIFYFVLQIVIARMKSDMAVVDTSASFFAAYSWTVLKDDYGQIFNKAILEPLLFFISFYLRFPVLLVNCGNSIHSSI